MSLPVLGVVVVTFNSSDVILDCLESLLAAKGVRLVILVVDNASTDHTPETLYEWAAGKVEWQIPADSPLDISPSQKPLNIDDAPIVSETSHSLSLIHSGVNGGFAFGVNLGLQALSKLPQLDRFWILNPDCVVPSSTARAFAVQEAPPGGFSLMGGRLLYLSKTNTIQTDGGRISWRTGITRSVNQYGATDLPPPDPSTVDFITGASMVVSRKFYETTGSMQEDYFLYYEEVDWALRRGKLPLTFCPEGTVYHRAGTSIGSATPFRAASPLSLFFINRARMRFLRRFSPFSLPGALAYSVAKAGQLIIRGDTSGAYALMRGSLGLTPPASVRQRLSPEAAILAFNR